MSQEELARFRKALVADSSLRRKIEFAKSGDEVTKIANEAGFDFTYEEWKAAPKLDPKIVWIFTITMIVALNWNLITYLVSSMNLRFEKIRRETLEQNGRVQFDRNTMDAPEKDWAKINECIARSDKLLNDEAMRTYNLIHWDDVSPEEIDERRKLLSKLTMEKIDRDTKCRGKGYF